MNRTNDTKTQDIGVPYKKRAILETYAISSVHPLKWSHNSKWYKSH